VIRNLLYSSLVFVICFVWVITGATVQAAMGVLGIDFSVALAMAVMSAALLATIFFIAYRFIRNRFLTTPIEPAFAPTKMFWITGVVLSVLAATVSGMQSYDLSKGKVETAQAAAKRQEDAARVRAEQIGKEQERLAKMSPAEREAEAKQKEDARFDVIVREGDALLKRSREWSTWGSASLAGKKTAMPDGKPVMKQEWADAKTRLGSITPEQRAYKRAQAILAAMAANDKRAAAEAAALQAKEKVEGRKRFAKRLEDVLVEKRMNTDVTASGPRNTVLTIKWALASKVTARDLSKSGVIEEAERAGFKKVVFTDGYDSGWKWDLNPKGD
jgi:hypothetical protein